jgi:hypothetical protein
MFRCTVKKISSYQSVENEYVVHARVNCYNMRVQHDDGHHDGPKHVVARLTSLAIKV